MAHGRPHDVIFWACSLPFPITSISMVPRINGADVIADTLSMLMTIYHGEMK